MNLKIFTTSRQIRKWLETKNDEVLDKHYSLGEFLNKIIVVDGFKIIDNDLRKKYLFEAIQNINVEKLGISREFINFFEDSDFIFSVFSELFLEKVDIDSVLNSDVYVEYEEHLTILKEILFNYENLLLKDNYIDKFLIKDYRINKGLLEGIEKIELVLDGYLTKFDVEVLKKIEIPIQISFEVDKFNKSLIEKSFGIEVKENQHYLYDFKNFIEEISEVKNPIIEVESFSERINQISFVFAKIKEFIESGIAPENIAVIFPSETFSEFFALFDEQENLNFAMGESFTKSNIYIKLKSIHEYLSGDLDSFKKCQDIFKDFQDMDLIELIKKHITNKELKVIDDELFKISRFLELFKDKKEFLYFILERLKDKKFDDTYSGKVTCMGVLESRGISFDGVILIDFNDGIVPNVSDNDLFLNTFIRKQAKLPTRFDKENLQKHYYYSLINNAKKVAIGYVENEENSPSKFLYELKLELGKLSDEKYQFFNFSKEKEIAKYNDEFNINFPLYPTTLKTLLECPKQYYFSKILRINESNDDEFFGNIFHDSMKDVVLENNFHNYEEYYEKLTQNIKSRISNKKLLFEVEVQWFDRLKKFCKEDFKYLSNYSNKPEQTQNFIFNGVKLGARIDRIDENHNEIILIDYKTSTKAKENEKYGYDFQTTFYYLWAKKHYQKEIKTYIWDIYKGELIEGIIKEEELKEVLNNLPKEVREAQDIEFPDGKNMKKATDICKYCPYLVACGKD